MKAFPPLLYAASGPGVGNATDSGAISYYENVVSSKRRICVDLREHRN